MIGFRSRKPAASEGPSDDSRFIVVRGGPSAPHQARRAIEAMASDLSSPLLGQVQLLATELISNSVRHGNVGPDGQVRVDFATPDGIVKISVTDSGPGFERTQPVENPNSAGGFGLLMVDRLARDWGVSRGGQCVWFELERQPAPPGGERTRA